MKSVYCLAHITSKDCVDKWFAMRQYMPRTCPKCRRNPLASVQAYGSSAPIGRLEVEDAAAEDDESRPVSAETITAGVDGPASPSQVGLLASPVSLELVPVSYGRWDVCDDESVDSPSSARSVVVLSARSHGMGLDDSASQPPLSVRSILAQAPALPGAVPEDPPLPGTVPEGSE
jgi:hypothetical protein